MPKGGCFWSNTPPGWVTPVGPNPDITDEGHDAAREWVERAPLRLPATDDSVAFILIVAAQFLPREIVWQRLLQLVVSGR